MSISSQTLSRPENGGLLYLFSFKVYGGELRRVEEG